MVPSYFLQNVCQRTDLQSPMSWNRHVMLPGLVRCQNDVRTGLPILQVSKPAQSLSQVCAGTVAGNLHAESTSSRMKCRRMILGRS